MSELDILQSAAIAAGITEAEGWEWSEREDAYRRRYGADWQTWNPLEDDGDAFRLAVKLKIDLLFGDRDLEAQATTGDEFYPFRFEDYRDDPYAATRRAIVRVAAQLVKET